MVFEIYKRACEIYKRYALKKTWKVRGISHLIFGTATVVFGLMFVDSSNNSVWHIFKFISVAVTFWISLHGAMDFVLRQGKNVSVWFSGMNLVTLGASMLLCLLAMAVNNNVFWYNISIISALLLYIYWDYVAIGYYKKKSVFWLTEYKSLRVYDFIILFTFFIANIPLLVLWFYPNIVNLFQDPIDAKQVNAFTAGISGVILSSQFLMYCVFSAIQAGKIISSENGVLAIQQGYNEWANIYDDRGNAIMYVERRHTSQRLNELNLQGDIIDLGCGTGFYTKKIIEAMAVQTIFAIDQNLSMLKILNKNISNNKIQIHEGIVTDLSLIADNSIDGILCCLVVDHLDKFYYPIMLRETFRVLKPNGFLYITDVNPYFQQLMQPYAKFINNHGEIRKIRVFPHVIKEVLSYFKTVGFGCPNINEVLVCEEDIKEWPDLGEENLLNFPLIFEYFIEKK